MEASAVQSCRGWVLELNSRRPIFANASLRMAVSIALDRPAAAGSAGALLSIDPPLPRDARNGAVSCPDLALARALAAGSVPATAELSMPLDPAAQELAEGVRAALAEIGVTVNLCSDGDGPFDLVLSGLERPL